MSADRRGRFYVLSGASSARRREVRGKLSPGRTKMRNAVRKRPRTDGSVSGDAGIEPTGVEGNRHRSELPGGAARIDILHEPEAERGKMGAGAIHHTAFRVANEKVQLDWRERLIDAGIHVSPVKDRLYFHSIYFREPGGVLFEIATDGPGSLIDEPAETLGSALCLPPGLNLAGKVLKRDFIMTIETNFLNYAAEKLNQLCGRIETCLGKLQLVLAGVADEFWKLRVGMERGQPVFVPRQGVHDAMMIEPQ